MKIPAGTRRITVNLPRSLLKTTKQRGALTEAIVQGLKVIRRRELADSFPFWSPRRNEISGKTLGEAKVLMDKEAWQRFLKGENHGAHWALRAGLLTYTPIQKIMILSLCPSEKTRQELGKALEELEELKLNIGSNQFAAELLSQGVSQEKAELMAAAIAHHCALLLGDRELAALAKRSGLPVVGIG